MSRRLRYAILLTVLLLATSAMGQQSNHCPYHFGSDMPEGTFCVYRGHARDTAGRACSGEMVVIWASAESPTATGSTVYVATVTEPGLVWKADVAEAAPHAQQRAQVVEYSAGEGAARGRADGEVSLSRTSSGRDTDRLALALSAGSAVPHGGDCALASFEGEFMGVIGRPTATARVY